MKFTPLIERQILIKSDLACRVQNRRIKSAWVFLMTFDFEALTGRARENCLAAKMEWIQSARWIQSAKMDSVCTRTLPAPSSQTSQCLGHAMHRRKARSNIEIMYIWNLGQALSCYLFCGFNTQNVFSSVCWVRSKGCKGISHPRRREGGTHFKAEDDSWWFCTLRRSKVGRSWPWQWHCVWQAGRLRTLCRPRVCGKLCQSPVNLTHNFCCLVWKTGKYEPRLYSKWEYWAAMQ